MISLVGKNKFEEVKGGIIRSHRAGQDFILNLAWRSIQYPNFVSGKANLHV